MGQSKQSVSRRLLALEAPLGVRLLERSTRALPDLGSLKAHVIAFVRTYNFAKHWKALQWKRRSRPSPMHGQKTRQDSRQTRVTSSRDQTSESTRTAIGSIRSRRVGRERGPSYTAAVRASAYPFHSALRGGTAAHTLSSSTGATGRSWLAGEGVRAETRSPWCDCMFPCVAVLQGDLPTSPPCGQHSARYSASASSKGISSCDLQFATKFRAHGSEIAKAVTHLFKKQIKLIIVNAHKSSMKIELKSRGR